MILLVLLPLLVLVVAILLVGLRHAPMLIVVGIFFPLGFLTAQHLLRTSSSAHKLDVDTLRYQLTTGSFYYIRDSAGCVPAFSPVAHLLKSTRIKHQKPPCRLASYIDRLWSLNVSSCGTSCSARENVMSCAQDDRDRLRGNTTVLNALTHVIANYSDSFSGEASCQQQSRALHLLGELGSANEATFLREFIERHQCENNSTSACQAARQSLQKILLQ